MSAITVSLRSLLAATPFLGLGSPGCEPDRPPAGALPPAYTFNKITDPALLEVVEAVKDWASLQVADAQKPLYSRIEVLHPVPIVQPYGVGVFQQEVRLPVIFTTGPGWADLSLEQKEEAAAQAFRDIAQHLQSMDHERAIEPTLTIQTPEGMALAWINRLEPGGKYIHGDD